MDFAGAQQTCFSDWGRTVLEFFPTPKFSIHDEVVLVFYNDTNVGHYNFGTGTGYLADGYERQDAGVVGRFASWQDISIDDFIQE